MKKARGWNKKTHGMWGTAEYLVWGSMLAPCNRPSATHYHRYGGRGITVCKRWDSFENFLTDMGLRPSSRHTIDRIDNDGNYEPDNCRWVLRKVQCNNRTSNKIVEYRGQKMTFTMAVEAAGVVCMKSAHRRVKHGWSLKRAIETPPGPQRNKRYG